MIDFEEKTIRINENLGIKSFNGYISLEPLTVDYRDRKVMLIDCEDSKFITALKENYGGKEFEFYGYKFTFDKKNTWRDLFVIVSRTFSKYKRKNKDWRKYIKVKKDSNPIDIVKKAVIEENLFVDCHPEHIVGPSPRCEIVIPLRNSAEFARLSDNIVIDYDTMREISRNLGIISETW